MDFQNTLIRSCVSLILSSSSSIADETEIELPVPDVKAAFADIFSAIEKGLNTIFKIDDDDYDDEETAFTGDKREVSGFLS